MTEDTPYPLSLIKKMTFDEETGHIDFEFDSEQDREELLAVIRSNGFEDVHHFVNYCINSTTEIMRLEQHLRESYGAE